MHRRVGRPLHDIITVSFLCLIKAIYAIIFIFYHLCNVLKVTKPTATPAGPFTGPAGPCNSPASHLRIGLRAPLTGPARPVRGARNHYPAGGPGWGSNNPHLGQSVPAGRPAHHGRLTMDRDSDVATPSLRVFAL